MLPNLGVTEQRVGVCPVFDPITTSAVSLFQRADSASAVSLDDLGGQTVAVVEGNVGERLLRGRDDLTVQAYATVADALVALLSGEVDGAVYPRRVALQWARADRS